MNQTIFSELSLIITIGAGIALIMRLIRQPLIIGHIITGILVGPSALHLVKSPETIEIFSSIGIALLLFIIGLGLNPKVIKEVGKVAGIAGMVQVGATSLLGWSLGVLLGFTRTESLFLGIGLAFSSTIIILKLLSDKKEQSRLYGKVATGLLLIQDLLATIALLFVTARSGPNGFSATQLGLLFVKGAAIAIPMLIIGNKVLPKLHRLIAGSQEFLFLFAIGWGFGSAALFEFTGFSLEVGALLAGISLASLPYTQEISARLRPLRDFFVVVFFIALGTRLSFANLGDLLPAVLISSLVAIVFKPLLILVIMGLLGYTKQTSFKAAIAMSQISEFSLIFVTLGNRQGLVGDNIVAVLTMVALISIACSAYLIIYADKIFTYFEHHLTMFERSKARFEQETRKTRYDSVLFGYKKGGHEFLKVFQSLKKPYIVVDYDPDVIDTLDNNKANYIYGDATDIELLDEIGLDKAKLVVCNISDYDTTVFLIKLLDSINPHAVIICHGDTVQHAETLYDLGASYVMMPHYIGSERMSGFIKKSGFKRSEFKRYRDKHLAHLQSHYAALGEE